MTIAACYECVECGKTVNTDKAIFKTSEQSFCSMKCVNKEKRRKMSKQIDTLPYRLVLKVRNLVRSPEVQAELVLDFDAPEMWSPSYHGLRRGSLLFQFYESGTSTCYDLDCQRFVLTVNDDFLDVWKNVIPASVADLATALPHGLRIASTRTKDASTHAALRALFPDATHELIEEQA